jgi:hypothetical protein
VEAHDKFPYIGSHQEVDWDEWEKVMTKSRFWSLSQLQEYFETNLSEVICIVEGIDPVSFRAMICCRDANSALFASHVSLYIPAEWRHLSRRAVVPAARYSLW